jgi:hypothetical protein
VDARKATKQLLLAANVLRNSIEQPAELDGRSYALHLIRNYIRDARLGDFFASPSRDRTSKEVSRYTRAARQKMLADSAMQKLAMA